MIRDQNLESIDVILAKIKESIDSNHDKNRISEDILELTDIVSEQQNEIADAILNDHDTKLVFSYIKAFTNHLEQLKSKNYTLSESEIQEIFKEALRPYLKSWLNNNISRIVREILEQEIRRVIDRMINQHQ